jgi:hypothetical protein
MGMEESSYDRYHYECMFCGKITESSSYTLDRITLIEMGSSSCPTICDNCKGPSKRPLIVCLCGSTKFKDAFTQAQLQETLAGKIVLTIGCNMKSDQEIFGHMSPEEFATTKRALDQLHFRKIEMANEVLILNVDGYIGLSTCDELNYARALNKHIRFLEEPKCD